MHKVKSAFIFGVVDCSSEGDKTGVSKKLSGQIAGFEKNGVTTTFIKRDDSGYWLTDGERNLIKVSDKQSKYSYKIKDEIAGRLREYYKNAELPDLLYCRGTRLFKGCRSLFSYLYQNSKYVVVEVPTVIKLRNQTSLTEFVKEIIDCLSMITLRHCINAVVVMSHDKKLYGIRTIKINNGIDSDKLSMIVPEPHHGIHMLGVAMMQRLHGYERVIEGLHQYYTTEKNAENIILDLVGEGPETSVYKALVEKYGLQEKVVFHGVLHGKSLDVLYNRCDIGIGAFGMYKSGLKNGSILKIKEYCAKGMPFIYACPEDTLDPPPYFCKMFSNDETPIDIKEVLAFYHGLEGELEKTRKEMRQFAEENLSWKKEMKTILDELDKKS